MTLPKFAKSAAVLAFTSGVEDHATAAALYDALEKKKADETVGDVLENFPGVQRWGEVDQMPDDSWWEEIQMLANCILDARNLFEV